MSQCIESTLKEVPEEIVASLEVNTLSPRDCFQQRVVYLWNQATVTSAPSSIEGRMFSLLTRKTVYSGIQSSDF